MYEEISKFINFIKNLDGIWNKEQVITLTKNHFQMVQDRKVFYTKNFSVRFSYSATGWFSNTVLSLSNLQKFDDKPFIVCLITKKENILYLANTTFLKKISHSSQELRIDNIKWSFNWSDIMKEYNDIKNTPENFKFLFELHKEIGFEDNLIRLVETTNWIAPIGKKFEVTNEKILLDAPYRALKFTKSIDFKILKEELDKKVKKYKNEIIIAAFIDNINIRWRIIEYLIAWESEELKNKLIEALHKKDSNIPRTKTKNTLGDYQKIFKQYHTETDIKTKIMVLNSNPKAYNIDKLLEFLSIEKSVFLFYFIGVEPNNITNQTLVSIFQKDLLRSTLIQNHWASRNSRWVAQFNGEIIEKLILEENNEINISESITFLQSLINK